MRYAVTFLSCSEATERLAVTTKAAKHRRVAESLREVDE
jgi:hypothetical protein